MDLFLLLTSKLAKFHQNRGWVGKKVYQLAWNYPHVLLKAGAQPNITDVYGNTCLHFPVIQGRRIEVLEAIIDYGVDVNASNKKAQTALLIATEKGNIDAINVLKAGADPNITNADGNTCLHLSILHGCRKEVVQMIIDHGAHVNATNKNGLTALMIVSCRGNVDGVNALLKTGADHNLTDVSGQTCLHYSIFGKWRREVLEMIIDHGAQVNDTGLYGHTALMIACERGIIDAINLLLKAGADVNISCAKGNTCLHHCVIEDCKNEVLQTMISCGAQVNAINKEGRTALMIASKSGNIEGINVLLKAGADPNIIDVDGNTCLHCSVLGNYRKEVLHMIIDHSVHLNAINKKVHTALMMASERGNSDAINVLLKAGADPNIIDADGNTCLHFLVLQRCNKEVLEIIIDHGVHVNTMNKRNETALMIASAKGNTDIIKVLLTAGADPNITDADGNACLHNSIYGNWEREVLQTIIDHGAHVNITNKEGHTALMIASRKGNIDGIKVLLEAGTDPSITDAHGNTCLHFTDFQGCSMEVLETLIDYGVDVNTTNKYHETAIMHAYKEGNVDAVNVLLNAGSDSYMASIDNAKMQAIRTVLDCALHSLQSPRQWITEPLGFNLLDEFWMYIELLIVTGPLICQLRRM